MLSIGTGSDIAEVLLDIPLYTMFRYSYKDVFIELDAALAQASETDKIAFAPSLDLFSVASSSISLLSIVN